jgi:hypothetical protein
MRRFLPHKGVYSNFGPWGAGISGNKEIREKVIWRLKERGSVKVL